MEQVKHFHDCDARCSAIVVDWPKLNKITKTKDELDTTVYLGNFFDDDSDTVWAVFGINYRRYCMKVS